MKTLTVIDYYELFGAEKDEVKGIGSEYLCYEDILYPESILIKVIDRIMSSDLSISGYEKLPIWEECWEENLQDFINSNFNVNALIPKYFNNNRELRYDCAYIKPITEDFLLKYTNMFREWIFEKYILDYDSIYDFGCGPAIHLSYIADNFPGKKLYGLDWAKQSQEIIKLLREHRGWDITEYNFDFFEPNRDIHIEPNSAVYTWGALEQVGIYYEEFIQYILAEKPKIVVNVEGLIELYNKNNMLGYLAYKYAENRNYLRGYLPRLQELESEGKLKILAVHHNKLSDLYDDTLSYVVWEPI